MAAENIIIAISDLFCGVICLLISIPLLRGRIKPNTLYGVRFKKSFESDELWYRINNYGARRMIFWSIIVMAGGIAALFVPFQGKEWYALLFALLPLVYLIAAIESWRYAQQL